MNDENLEECFAKKINRFSCGLRHIDQVWQNRLAGKQIRLAENYIDGDFGLLFVLEAEFGGGQNSGYPGGKSRYVGYLDAKISHGATNGLNIDDVLHDDSGHNQIVLIDVIELGDGPDKMIASSVAVRLYPIEDKVLNTWEGDLYRTLTNGVFEVFPRFVKREQKPLVASCGSVKRRPNMVECTAEIVDSVADGKGNVQTSGAEEIRTPFLGRIIAAIGNGVLNCQFLKIDQSVFKLVDVAIGPFNLKFGATEDVGRQGDRI